MSYIINEAFFQRKYQTPNSAEAGSIDNNLLTQLIDEKARLFIQDALGYELFKDFDDNVTNGDLDVGAPQKWKDLVNGVEYTLNGKLFKWNGLKYEEGAFKGSILTPYVYYYWLEENLSITTGMGQVVGTSKNATGVNSGQKMVTIWNEMVQLNQYDVLCNNQPIRYNIGGVMFTDWFKTQESNYVSLIKFLTDKETDYPDANKKVYGYKNQLGL
jgi:hypothetical protein